MSSDNEETPEAAAQRLARPERPKRFYTTVTVEEVDGQFAVHLDGRRTRTPAKKLLAVPNRVVAEAIAAEWDAQEKEIDPAVMPLTRLVNAAIDRVVDQMNAVREDVVRHAGTDLILYRAGEPEALVAAEAAAWDPICDWARDELGASFRLATGIIHEEQDQAALDAVEGATAGYGVVGLAALHVATTLTGSAVIALALARGRLTTEEAWALAHVDEDWQMDRWGQDTLALRRRAERYRELEAAALILAQMPDQ